MTKTLKALFIVLLLSFSFQGCAPKDKDLGRNQTFYRGPVRPVALTTNTPTIFTVAQDIAAQLRANLRDGELGDWPLIVTTLVDIDDLTKSTRFGRALAESIGAEIFRQGGQVKEVRITKGVYIVPQTGELMLSRDVKQLAKDAHAKAVVAGTYSIGAFSVIVNLKMLDLYSGNILSVATAEIARNKTIDTLLGLKTEVEPTTYDARPL